MKLSIISVTLFSSLVCSIPSSDAVVYTDDPVLPRAVVIKGEGTIVNPDLWTQFPTLSPVNTLAPSAFPTETTAAVTSDYLLMRKGSRRQCPGASAVPELDCKDAAMDAGGDYNFPYYLNKIEIDDMPCGCFFWFNDNGSVIIDYNTPPSANSCLNNANAQLICVSCGSVDDKQTKYRGSISVTESGETCQAWDSQSPHSHTYDPDNYQGEGLRGRNNNYCRNPNQDRDKAWCYTENPSIPWEYCDVPYCEA